MNQLVEQIHNEFNSVASEILGKENPSNSGKTERLKAMGFERSKDIEDMTEIEWAKYYSFYYPLNKFITKKAALKICGKYDLIMGPVGNYKGSVPVNKLHEIEKFKIRKEDRMIKYLSRWSRRSAWSDGERPAALTRLLLGIFNPLPETLFTFYAWKKTNNALYICAPSSEMETSGWSIRNNEMIPDPVVLMEVSGGFLIIAAWGPEASDESALNEKMN